MNVTIHDPDTITPPASRYAQGVCVDGATRWLHVSGQVGLDPDGALAGGVSEQMQRCFENIRAVLEDAGMDITNLVKITGFIVNPHDLPAFREARDAALGGHRCASTLLVVSALAVPDWVVEIEAVAAA